MSQLAQLVPRPTVKKTPLAHYSLGTCSWSHWTFSIPLPPPRPPPVFSRLLYQDQSLCFPFPTPPLHFHIHTPHFFTLNVSTCTLTCLHPLLLPAPSSPCPMQSPCRAPPHCGRAGNVFFLAESIKAAGDQRDVLHPSQLWWHQDQPWCGWGSW